LILRDGDRAAEVLEHLHGGHGDVVVIDVA
jgi:hypothetical protein